MTWWKYLTIVLLAWVLGAGMLVPLRTGISDRSPIDSKTDTTIWVKVEGYNARWLTQKAKKAYLHYDFDTVINNKKEVRLYAIATQNIKTIDDRNIECQFVIPKFLPINEKNESANLVVESENSEPAILPSAISLSQDSINTALGRTAWNASMNIERPWRFQFPYRNLLYETIRNTFYHVPMWFVMFTLFGIALFHCVKYLRTGIMRHDTAAVSYTTVGILFGFLGLFSGALWAKNTWGDYFPMDIKILMTYTALAIYLAYFILRMSFDNFEQRARISAVYAIFAFSTLIPLLYVIPKISPDSLHPGNGSNPAFGTQDMDNTLRMVFYPACIGWIMLGIWLGQLTFRYNLLKEYWAEKSNKFGSKKEVLDA